MEQRVRVAMPKPTGVTRALLFLIGGLGVGNAILVNWLGHAELFRWLALTPQDLPWQIQRFVTAIVLTDPSQYGHLLFSLLLLYFFGPAVESKMGARRFLALLVGGGVAGSLLGLVGNLTGIGKLSSPLFFGPNGALEALVVAWSMQNAALTFNLMFVLPMRGAWMKWISLGFCVLGLLYPNPPPEGVLAGFGGFAVGFLFGGQPSLVRHWFLRGKLAKLEGQKRKLQKQGPSLHVVYGGLADELGVDKKRGERDKRTLN